MDDSLYCNIAKCRQILTDAAWVTRCLHVFCPDHGQIYFLNSSSQINCPVCNEANVKESDIILCDLNPSDMILAGLSPDKVIALAAKSVKLWKAQNQIEYRNTLQKIGHLSKKMATDKCLYEKNIRKLKMEHSSIIDKMKSCYFELVSKLKTINKELDLAKDQLNKYKVAYRELKLRRPLIRREISPVINPLELNDNHLRNIIDQMSQSEFASENFLSRQCNL